MLNKLTKAQLKSKADFIEQYTKAANAADGSLVDANANVTIKTIATLEAELYKYETIQLNRELIKREITEAFGSDLAEQYEKDIESHLIYIHDETSLKPYCASVTLYPYLFEGTKGLGGTSKAPTNLQSFCGSFVNLVYQLASGFAGAIATVEFLMYFDHFAKRTYGETYLDTHRKEVEQALQGVVYSLNEPASARGNQSVFWNISLFDQYFFESLFGEFVFPDGSHPTWSSLSGLQALFVEWFRIERTKELLTFPVVTQAMLVDGEEPKDHYTARRLAEQMSKGFSCFIYMSETVDSLASCCRLRNELMDNTFSYSLGAGGVSTGSIQVITINMNRCHQNIEKDLDRSGTFEDLPQVITRIQKYLLAHYNFQKKQEAAGLLPAYTQGFITMKKQFLTIGINGLLEGWEESREWEGDTQEDFMASAQSTLKCINELNKVAKKEYGVMFNTEFVPAESLGVKNAQWDKKDGLRVPRDCYNSYFYAVEDQSLTILDKMKLHGREMIKYLDGGSALHLNLEQLPSAEGYMGLFRAAAKNGVNYWTTNVLCTICNSCGHIDPTTRAACAMCGSPNIDYGTRIIGYLKRITSFSKERQAEHMKRSYMK